MLIKQCLDIKARGCCRHVFLVYIYVLSLIVVPIAIVIYRETKSPNLTPAPQLANCTINQPDSDETSSVFALGWDIIMSLGSV